MTVPGRPRNGASCGRAAPRRSRIAGAAATALTNGCSGTSWRSRRKKASTRSRATRRCGTRRSNSFVSFVTHQLRTPLAGIKWMLELATDAESAEEVTSYIQDARESAERLIRLVNDLLDASRLEGGKLQVVLAPLQLREVTDNVLTDLASLVHEKGHTLTLDAAAGLPNAMLDLQLLRQVIVNLLSNAIKYTPRGGRI